MSDHLTPNEVQAIRRTLARGSEQGWGIALGTVCGIGLFVATVILLLRDDPHRGTHLGLLRIYFPGYSVSWVGSLIGFVYAFVGGYAAGRTMAIIYNRVISD
jgi:amino acid transporter